TRRLGARHPDVAVSLNNLAILNERRGDTDRASAQFGQAARTLEHALGHDHPKAVDCRRNYERCLAVNSRM
ncbi:MAG TPA: tetratricopeptide repeat protein, partial [Gemmatimonadaceae bacterium]|nr:tetratricopeptide repeat protein [Gemmatimonadaceae bacterium]